MTPPGVVLDVDGTLVDTNYQHTLAWHEAFRQHGVELPIWQIHRAVGMGGDQLVPALAGEDVDAEQGDEIRAAEGALYMAQIRLVRPLPGAREFVVFLVERGHPVVLSSSAKEPELEFYLELLGVADQVEGWTTSADVRATKPEPDVVRAGLEKLGNPDSAVLVGDSVFDVAAARRAGVPAIALRTGGFGADELSDLGAVAVFASLDDLREGYAETPLAG